MAEPRTRWKTSTASTPQIVLLAVLFNVVAFAAIAFGVWRWRVAVREKQEDAARAERQADEAARARKSAPILDVAPAKVAASVLEGPDGTDANGYPKKFVSQPAVRSLLHFEKYPELTTAIEDLQAAFEADPHKEYWAHDAVDAFGSAEPALRVKLDRWAAASPRSFAPYVARAAHLVAVGFFERGSAWAKDTPPSSFAAMNQSFAEAQRDLERAMVLHPKLLTAIRLQIAMRAANSRSDGLAEVENATLVCPSCIVVRTTYLAYATPRWGGSYEEMDRFSASLPVNDHPRLRVLRGWADIDRARVAMHDKNDELALAHVEKACSFGEYWPYLVERAIVRRRMRNYDAALVDANRAAELRPRFTTVLFERAAIYDARDEWELAARDLLDALRVEPTDEWGRAHVDRVVKGLDFRGDQHAKAGRRDDALRALDLAAELQPSNSTIQRRRAAVINGMIGPHATPAGDDLAALEDKARDSPDDFRAQQALDYALARRGDYERVVEIWNAYLARHPDDGRGYLERGGAHHHLKRHAEAHADASKACDLGINEGCTQARRH